MELIWWLTYTIVRIALEEWSTGVSTVMPSSSKRKLDQPAAAMEKWYCLTSPGHQMNFTDSGMVIVQKDDSSDSMLAQSTMPSA